MALVLADRVRETTTSNGTSAVTLGGAYTGFQTFLDTIGNANDTYYTISNVVTGEWEVGIGTYTSSGNTLSRDTVLSSSNAGSLVSFTTGTKDVFVTQPAERNVYVVGSNVVAENSATVPNSLLANSSVTLGSTSVSLGATASTLAGLTSVAATNFTGAFDGVLGGVTPAAATVTTLGVTTVNATTVNATTVDTTNLEVTNLKAKDGTAAGSIADATGVVTLASSVLTTTDINGGTIDGTAIGGSTAAAGAFTTLSATGVTTVQAGTAAAPAITTTGDTNTGFFFPAADTIGASEGGVSIGNMNTWYRGLFCKTDPTIVAWTKTGAGTATTSSILYIEVNGALKTIASGTSISMPTLASGTDYAIWAKTDGTLQATTDHTSPPTANARKVGGFHYAPGGNATGTSGGDTTPAINEYSMWDLKWRPTAPDPRGMTLVGGGYWSDIYLTGVDAITNGSSKYNVTMADGSSPPKVPTMFGGNGSTTYGIYAWFEAMELATAFGKRCPTQAEFMSLAYGTTEASSIGSDQGSTILNAAYTSKWGVMQAAGVLFVWGRDRGGAYNTSGWNANTEGRGSEYNAPNSALFGGAWGEGANAGSRCSAWSASASASGNAVGSRFVSEHLQLD